MSEIIGGQKLCCDCGAVLIDDLRVRCGVCLTKLHDALHPAPAAHVVGIWNNSAGIPAAPDAGRERKAVAWQRKMPTGEWVACGLPFVILCEEWRMAGAKTYEVRALVLATDHEALRAQLAAKEQECERLREALESIREYWNRDANHDAMLDACQHNVDTADAALAGKEGK